MFDNTFQKGTVPGLSMHTFADANYASEAADTRSVSGGLVKYGGACVSWFYCSSIVVVVVVAVVAAAIVVVVVVVVIVAYCSVIIASSWQQDLNSANPRETDDAEAWRNSLSHQTDEGAKLAASYVHSANTRRGRR